MACYHPIRAYRSRSGPDPVTGKWPLVFSVDKGYADLVVEVPCGQCIGCRIDRSRDWAIRCVHEAQLHPQNCFITLTYDEEHVPKDMSLNKTDMQLFLKRFRFEIAPQKIRFFQCGEYGEHCKICHMPRYKCESVGCGKFVPDLGRPHHHAIIFGYDFPDKILFSQDKGVNLYVSQVLSRLWPFGFSTVGDVTFESSAYVARYIQKKINGDKADKHYQGKLPEFITMSRKPGIAHDWYQKYGGDVYENDYVIFRNRKFRPPQYYDRLYDADFDIKPIKKQRQIKAIKASENVSPLRLFDREKIKQKQIDKLKRSL